MTETTKETTMSKWIAEWERNPKRGVFAGCWRVREVPEVTMLSCSPGRICAPTREGIKEILHGMGNHHPVRFITRATP